MAFRSFPGDGRFFLALFGYLAFLAFEVFGEFASLPVVLGGLGILLIAVTVRAQGSFPALVQRVNAERAGKQLPAAVSWLPFLLTFGVALLLRPSMDEVGSIQDHQRRLEELRRERRAKPEVPSQRASGESDTLRVTVPKSN